MEPERERLASLLPRHARSADRAACAPRATTAARSRQRSVCSRTIRARRHAAHADAVRYESGDRAGALAEYERFARKLRAELDAEPMAETSALYAFDRARRPARAAARATARGFRQARRRAAVRRPRRGARCVARAWDAAAAGNGGLVLIGGEAGIGKTRLVREFAAGCEASGALVYAAATTFPERRRTSRSSRCCAPAAPLLQTLAVDPLWLSALARWCLRSRNSRPSCPRSPPSNRRASDCACSKRTRTCGKPSARAVRSCWSSRTCTGPARLRSRCWKHLARRAPHARAARCDVPRGRARRCHQLRARAGGWRATARPARRAGPALARRRRRAGRALGDADAAGSRAFCTSAATATRSSSMRFCASSPRPARARRRGPWSFEALPGAAVPGAVRVAVGARSRGSRTPPRRLPRSPPSSAAVSTSSCCARPPAGPKRPCWTRWAAGRPAHRRRARRTRQFRLRLRPSSDSDRRVRRHRAGGARTAPSPRRARHGGALRRAGRRLAAEIALHWDRGSEPERAPAVRRPPHGTRWRSTATTKREAHLARAFELTRRRPPAIRRAAAARAARRRERRSRGASARHRRAGRLARGRRRGCVCAVLERRIELANVTATAGASACCSPCCSAACAAQAIRAGGRALEPQARYRRSINDFEGARAAFAELARFRSAAVTAGARRRAARVRGHLHLRGPAARGARGARRVAHGGASRRRPGRAGAHADGVLARGAEQQDYVAMSEFATEALEISRAIGDREGEALALHTIANGLVYTFRVTEAGRVLPARDRAVRADEPPRRDGEHRLRPGPVPHGARAARPRAAALRTGA